MKFIDKVFTWLLSSSANPSAVSLSVKGFLTAGAAAIVPLLGLTHINIGNDQINTVIDDVSLVVQDGLLFVGAVGAVVGFIRKLVLTVTGKNPTVTAQ